MWELWEAPEKFHTECVNSANGAIIQNLDIEAINRSEAEARAYLNCVLATNGNKSIKVSVRVR
jgi:hypothetical protein